MKTKLFLFSMFAILCFSTQKTMAIGDSKKSPNTITVVTSPEIYDLTVSWVNEYQKVNPSPMIKVIRYSVTSKTDLVKSGGDLFFLTDDYKPLRSDGNSWKMVIGRDPVVMVFNKSNPLSGEIHIKGINPENLAKSLGDPGKRQWGTLLGEGQATPVHYYLLNEESLRQKVGKFLGMDLGFQNATMISSGAELTSFITKDPYAIGFCRLSDVLDPSKKQLSAGIVLLPVDKNRNGHLDNFEDIYGSIPDFLHGVWIGMYPGALSRDIFTVAPVKPENDEQVAFLKWILADGQQYLNSKGYSDLTSSERIAKSDLLDNKVNLASNQETNHPIQTLIFILALVIISASILTWIFGLRRNKKTNFRKEDPSGIKSFDETVVEVPKGLWFDKSHTWAFMEQDGMVRVGIDDFLPHITGLLTRIKMRNPGEEVKKGEVILTIIQNGKQLNIFSPVSGTIHTQNGLLNSQSSMLSSSPFTDGWVYMIEPSNWLRETQFLFMAENYTKWLKQEFVRLKDFFASSALTTGYIPIVLQDGGVLKDNVLAGFGPEVWEDFQVKFIDAAK